MFLRKVFKVIFFTKWIFQKPEKKRILIFDRVNSKILCKVLNLSNYGVLDVRYESINLYVCFITLLNTGYKNYVENYILNYVKLTNPRIVITFIDNNPFFYRLKKLYKEPSYLSFQNGIRDHNFSRSISKYIKEKKIKLTADHLFLFGENDRKRYLKLIHSKIHIHGNIINNFFSNARQVGQKIDSIIFISSQNKKELDRTFLIEKRTFNYLIKYCKKNKKKLIFLSKYHYNEERNVRKYFDEGGWVYIGKKDLYGTIKETDSMYKSLNKSLLVFNNTTLGYEALARGLKCVTFDKKLNYCATLNNNKYPDKGIFWANPKNYKEVEKKINDVIKIPRKKWIKSIKKYSDEIIAFDYKNKKTINILKKLLKKN